MTNLWEIFVYLILNLAFARYTRLQYIYTLEQSIIIHRRIDRVNTNL